jgi:hypothetical protein
MDFIKLNNGARSRIFYNWLDCPYGNCCPDREEREKTLIKHRCAFNPSIFECETYKRFEKGLGDKKLGVDFNKVYDLEKL